MSRFHPCVFRSVLALAVSSWAMDVQAQEFRYRYVPLDQVELPSGFEIFYPIALGNGGRVYGTAFPFDVSASPQVAVYDGGVVTALAPGLAFTASRSGLVGGGVLLDPVAFTTQAALFRGGKVELIPRLPGEYTSNVMRVTDSGLALVVSYDENFQSTLLLSKNGRLTPLPIDGSFLNFLDMNNRGQISGITFVPGLGYRAFRFDTRTGESTLLDPLPTEPHSWGMAINDRGDVLGYSFVFSAVERIGVWDSKGGFQTYFVEGTPQFPTVSNRLRFNDNNLIVITDTFDDNSYLVPNPGVRLNLSDLVVNLPPGQGALRYVINVNNHGDMLGFGPGFNGAFLLERIGVGNQ
jgi:hypothetical protein